LKTVTSTIAMSARTMIPFENAKRSPRAENWRGMKRSLARMPESRGKSAKAVFAARTRRAKVEY
jgi:hypothetical protein